MNKEIDEILSEYRMLGTWQTVYLMFFVSLIIFITLVIVDSNKFLYAILLVINILFLSIYGHAIKMQRMKCDSLKQLLYIVVNKHKEALKEND